MKPIFTNIFFLVLLLCSYSVIGQVKFSASISPAQIGRNEYAQLKLSVENAKEVQDIQPPELNNFIVISGPNQESGMSMVNGVVKKYIAISYILRPKAPGSYTISPATAKADGSTFKSNTVSLKVSNANTSNQGGSSGSPFSVVDPFAETVPESVYPDYILRKGENAIDKIKKNMFVKLETDKTSCFVGEPIVAKYKLYTRLKSESTMSKNPSFNGFSVIDLQQPDNVNYTREKLNGREYNVYTIRKAQLYPLQPGNLELEVAEIDNNIHFIKEEYARRQSDLFGDLFGDFASGVPEEGLGDHRLILQSKPMSILVKPLPDINKPANFKGAVGNFSIEANLAPKSFSTDDAGNLTVIINGVGNLQLVTSPEIRWPEGIDGFDPKINDDLFKTTVPVSGRKIIEFPFTVASAGSYTIPAVEFSFFDPKEGEYKTVASKPIEFTVTKGSGKRTKIDTSTNTIQHKESLLNKFFSNRLRVVSVVAILIILGLLVWLKRENKKDKLEKIAAMSGGDPAVLEAAAEKTLHEEQNPLAHAEQSLQSGSPSFYVTLNQSLKNYLSATFHIPAEELNKKNIAEQLDKSGIPIDTCLQLHQLMDEIEWQLYTPSVDDGQKKEMYERTNDLVQLIESYRFKHL